MPWLLVATLVANSGVPSSAVAADQQGLRQPVYRTAKQPQQRLDVAARTTVSQPEAQLPFDLTQRPGEHPLAPALRLAKAGLEQIDANIKDYSCTLIKRERVDGVLGEHQYIYTRVRHEPFSVHMFFLKPYKGRECLFVEGTHVDDGRTMLRARGEGWKKRLGPITLDPLGKLAMDGQKYPIMKVGLRNLTSELIEVASNDLKFGECDVKTKYNVKIRTRPDQAPRVTTMIEAIHPVPRKNFRFHRVRIFIDNELQVPIRYASWLWPTQPGGKLPLEEEYTYADLKINNGFTDFDFSEQNPEIFKK